jgi:hypothetical protein
MLISLFCVVVYQADQFLRKVEVEKKRIEEMVRQISQTQDTIMHLRREMKGVNSMSDVNAKVQKDIHLLENKLDKALIKLNEALTHNKGLREQIESLRRERQVFDGVYKKLEQELRDKKREMASIVDLYNEAYRRRDECYAEMAELKAKADEEQIEFESEWRRLSLIVEEDRRKTALFSPTMAHKLGGTVAADAEGGPSNAGTLPVMSDASAETQEMEQSLKQRIYTKNFDIESDRAAIDTASKKVTQMEETFAKIQRETGIAQMDELVLRFVQSEDANFSLFNYVNDLGLEIEAQEEQLAKLNQEFNKYKDPSEKTPKAGAASTDERKSALEELDAKLAKAQSEQAAWEVQANNAQKSVAAFKEGIMHLHQKYVVPALQSGEEAEPDMDGRGAERQAPAPAVPEGGVTDVNMLQFLGVLEHRAEAMLKKFLVAAFDSQGHSNPSGAAHYFLHPPATNTVNVAEKAPEVEKKNIKDKEATASIPTIAATDDGDSDDDNLVPLTRDELQKRALRDLPDLSKKGKKKK